MKHPLEGIIEDVITDPSKIPPIIVNFQNGEIKDEEAKKMSCGVYCDQKKEKTMLALSNGQIVYRGYKPDTGEDFTRTMLVLRNKQTGKVRLVQAERWQVAPVLRKPIAACTATSEAQIATLNKQFGSKKVKRRTEQYEKMKIDVKALKNQLETTVANVEIDRMELSSEMHENDFITNTALPACNREATDVNDVYNVYDIIPKVKLETLFDKVTEMLNDDSSSLKGKSKFFSKTFKQLKLDTDNIKKIALLLYIQTVSAWLNMPIKDAKKRSIEICTISQEVNAYVIDTYSIEGSHGRMRPNSMRDKGLIHCMILALVICNFTLDLELFATIFSLRVGHKKFIALARIIGALPNKNDKNTVTLKVPLPAPPSVARKGKKK